MAEPTYQKNIALNKDEVGRSEVLKDKFNVSYVNIYRKGLEVYEQEVGIK